MGWRYRIYSGIVQIGEDKTGATAPVFIGARPHHEEKQNHPSSENGLADGFYADSAATRIDQKRRKQGY